MMVTWGDVGTFALFVGMGLYGYVLGRRAERRLEAERRLRRSSVREPVTANPHQETL